MNHKLTTLAVSAIAITGCIAGSIVINDDVTRELGYRGIHGEMIDVNGEIQNYSKPAGFRAIYFPAYGDELELEVSYVGHCQPPFQIEILVDDQVTKYDNDGLGKIDCYNQIHIVEKSYMIPISKIRQMVNSNRSVLLKQTFPHSFSTYRITDNGIEALQQALDYIDTI